MVPIGQPATMQEVRKIAADPALLSKTVFVRPADRKSRSFAFAPDPSVRTIGGMWDWTLAQVRDVLPHFPGFSGGARLIVFDGQERALEFAGNGVCSIQQSSSIRRFLTEGNARISDWLVIPCLIMTMVLIEAGPFLVMFDSAAQYSAYPDWRELKGMVGFSVLRNMLIVPLLIVAAYKLRTSDLPRRLGLPVAMGLALLFVGSVLFSLFVAQPDQWGQDRLNALFSASFMLASFARGLLLYSASAILLGRPFIGWHLGVVAMLAAISTLIRVSIMEMALAGTALPDWLEAANIARNVVFAAIALALPAVSGVQRNVAIKVGLSALVAAAAYIWIGLALFEHWYTDLFVLRAETMDCDAACALSTAWNELWVRFTMSLATLIPVFGWILLVRRATGLGAPWRWSGPIELPPHHP
jgi:hypothetical protein